MQIRDALLWCNEISALFPGCKRKKSISFILNRFMICPSEFVAERGMRR
ncbi:hypothetical protein [Morganella morganii IS15]|nr:hypothetical protein C790_00881 [Morganella morganii SC01]CDK66794.1 hypothetical protein [Morganella morganii IS15]